MDKQLLTINIPILECDFCWLASVAFSLVGRCWKKRYALLLGFEKVHGLLQVPSNTPGKKDLGVANASVRNSAILPLSCRNSGRSNNWVFTNNKSCFEKSQPL